MVIKSFVACAAVLAATAGTQASFSSSEMQSQNWGFGLSPGSQTLTFNKFDTLGGTRVLKGVEFQFEATIGANVTAENDSAISVSNFGVNLTGIATVDINGGLLNGTAGIIQNAGPVSVGATDGIPASGPDFHDFGLLSGTDSDGSLAFPNPAWIGPGTFNADVDGSGGFATSGTTDATIRLQNFGAEGFVKVIFYYDVVPAPGAAALFGLAGFAAARRRRA